LSENATVRSKERHSPVAKLTLQHKAFLKSQDIPLSSIFDATGMTKYLYHEAMRAEDKLIAYGLNPCPKGGHTLRTRNGSCPQCNTACLAYLKRYNAAGYVYIAGSKKRRLIKVGASGNTNNIDNRVVVLNVRAEGGTSDWEYIAHIYLGNDAYRIESAVHRELREWRKKIEYIYNAKKVTSQECFSCGYTRAKDVLLRNAEPYHLPAFRQRTDFSDFEFEPRSTVR
jgi:hypothetical protein